LNVAAEAHTKKKGDEELSLHDRPLLNPFYYQCNLSFTLITLYVTHPPAPFPHYEQRTIVHYGTKTKHAEHKNTLLHALLQ
jgi:hypothetical protein